MHVTTSSLVAIATDSLQTFVKMCLRDVHTATESGGRRWSIVLQKFKKTRVRPRVKPCRCHVSPDFKIDFWIPNLYDVTLANLAGWICLICRLTYRNYIKPSVGTKNRLYFDKRTFTNVQNGAPWTIRLPFEFPWTAKNKWKKKKSINKQWIAWRWKTFS